MGVTPGRHVRVPDELWDPAKAKAASEFRDISDVVREGLRNYLGVLAPEPPMAGPPAGAEAAEREGAAPVPPKPRRCPHPGTRNVGGFCKECDHLVGVGGYWK